MHGCVSCTLREDLLPLLRRLAVRSEISTLVLQLDPILEPETVSRAISQIPVAGPDERPHGPAALEVCVRRCVTTVSEVAWLSDAVDDVSLEELGYAGDDRTLGQIAVGQVEFADVLVLHGPRPATDRQP